jgi:hypothetical protein
MGTGKLRQRYLYFVEQPVAFLDDARHSGRATYGHDRKPWPREFLTLALVSACIAFWALALLAVGLI